MICGQVKSGTYAAGYPMPTCTRDRWHSGMHSATVSIPARGRDNQIPPGDPGNEIREMHYQWTDTIELAVAVG